MSRKVKYCAHHPDTAATGSCAECGKDICYNCSREYKQQIFCSVKCIRQYIFKQLDKKLHPVVKIPIKIILWPFLHLLQVYRWHVLEWALVLGLAVALYQINSLHHKLDDVKTTRSTLVMPDAPVDTTFLPKPRVFSPVKGGRVVKNSIDVTVVSESNWIIAVTVDDNIYDVNHSKKGGKIVFKDIPLRRGDNHLEVRAMNASGEVFTLQSLDIAYGYPNLEYLAKSIRRGPTDRKMIAFTFDGGADNNVADEILDFLKEKNAKSTFFLTGKFIRLYKETVKRIVDEGHEVGNHSWSHPHLTSYARDRKHITLESMDKVKLQEELSKTAGIFKIVSNQDMVGLWRAPYGEYNQEILSWAAEAGYKHIAWTVGRGWEENMDTLDWVADKDSKIYFTADEIAKKILGYDKKNKHGANGAIVLMHLGSNRKDDFPHKKLPEIIDGLRDQGYALVTVSEMLGI